MRRPLLALLLLSLLPLLLASTATTAVASKGAGATFEARVDRDPAVGERVTLTLAATLAESTDRRFELQVPAWVEVEGDRAWRVYGAEGERIERSWNVTPTRAGFWRVGLARDEGDGVWTPLAGCCLHVWSTQARGIASPEADHALPAEAAVGFHASFAPVDAERVDLTVRITPQDGRYAGQTFRFESPVGEPDPQRAPSDAAHAFTEPVALRDGGRVTIAAAGFVEVAFEDGPRMRDPAVGVQRIACATFTLERAADEVREVGRTGCTTANEAADPSDGTRPIPLDAFGSALALLVGCAAVKPIRRRLLARSA